MATERCFSDQCALPSDVPELYDIKGRQALCDSMRTIIAAAGGAGALEIQPCPFDAIDALGDDSNDSPQQAATRLAIRTSLGVSFDVGSEV